MAQSKRSYSDSEKAKYWREKALSGAKNARSNSKNYTPERAQIKRSAATFTKISKGKMEGLWAVTAFRKTKSGLVKASAMPIDNKSTESAKGNQYIPYLVTCIHMGTLQKSVYNGIMNIQTRVLVISELGMCITPNGSGVTGTGTKVRGYFGTFVK